MREILLAVACVALLLAAAGLLLWQWAKGRQARQLAGRHLKHQIQVSTAEGTPVPMPVRDPANDGLMTGVTSDPWLNADAGGPAAPPAGLLEKALPDRLAGVIAPRTAALGLLAIVAMAALAGVFGGWLPGASALALLILLAAFAVWEEWLNLIVGLWALVSPWVLGFQDVTLAMWSTVATGVALGAVALGATLVPRAWEEWTEGALAIWLAVSPWVLGFATVENAMVNAVLVSAAILVLALWVLVTDKDYLGGAMDRHAH